MPTLRAGELVEREKKAWRCYAGRVRGLEGPAYERAEKDAWAELRAELRTIEQLRVAPPVAEEDLPQAA